MVDISAKDIRALQADIAIIKEAVYLAPLAELGIPIASKRSIAGNSFGLFALVNTSFAASQNALLAAQPLRALP